MNNKRNIFTQQYTKISYKIKIHTITEVAPLAKGPQTTYECPVIQPMSAVHQYMSPG